MRQKLNATVLVGFLVLIVGGGGLLVASTWAFLVGDVASGIFGIAVFIPNALLMIRGLHEELSW